MVKNSKKSWQHFCKQFVLPWLKHNCVMINRSVRTALTDHDKFDLSIHDDYIQYLDKFRINGVPETYPNWKQYYHINLLAEFMEDLLSRRMISYIQFSAEPVTKPMEVKCKKRDREGNPIESDTEISLSLMDRLLRSKNLLLLVLDR